jgi:long-chain acyl-CoA synthetase
VALRRKRLGIWHEITWGEYSERVRDATLALHEHGVGPGSRTAIVADNAPEWVMADLATQSVGGAAVALHPALPAAEAVRTIEAAAVRVAFCGDAEHVEKLLGDGARPAGLERIVVFDMRGVPAGGDPPVEAFADLLARGRALHDAQPDLHEWLLAERSPDEIAVIAHTSGTTGTPRGALLSQRGRVAMARAFAAWAGLSERDRAFSLVPLAHPAARLADAHAALVGGGSVAYAESVETALDDLVEVAPTFLLASPRALERIRAEVEIRIRRAAALKRAAYRGSMRWLGGVLDRELAGRRRPQDPMLRIVGRWLAGRWVLDKVGMLHLRRACSAGGLLAPELQRYFLALGAPLLETYGQAETGGVALAQGGPGDVGTVGVPLAGVQASIGADGDLLLRGSALLGGYLGDGEDAAAPIDPEGWLRTGDLARLDSEGRVVIRDRRERVLRTAEGMEILASEIESALELSPYVNAAMAVAEGRPFPSALLQIEYGAVVEWAHRRSLPDTTFRTLTERPEVLELIDGEVACANASLDGSQRVREFRLVPRELELERGEITPAGVIRRHVIERGFAALIDDMYGASHEPVASAREDVR